jgi:hypothetical protein
MAATERLRQPVIHLRRNIVTTFKLGQKLPVIFDRNNVKLTNGSPAGEKANIYCKLKWKPLDSTP